MVVDVLVLGQHHGSHIGMPPAFIVCEASGAMLGGDGEAVLE